MNIDIKEQINLFFNETCRTCHNKIDCFSNFKCVANRYYCDLACYEHV